MKKNWYVVYTRSHCEKKVAAQLDKKEVEYYCPLNRVIRKWADRKKMVHEPLFSSYVFVRSNEQFLYQIKQLSSDIVNFVYWLGKPAIVRDDEIENIKLFLSEYTNVKLERSVVRIGDAVRILSGPLMNQEGNIAALKNQKVKLILPSLGYAIIAETQISNIEVVGQSYTNQRVLSNLNQ